ncbi:site-specific integrase [Streptosporangium sp. NPDC049046]|uniref:site-specific integrase n=1 Tax=Streptosporangium sp. NPDC049046 TaxID=3155031 RepID=UPI00342C83A5
MASETKRNYTDDYRIFFDFLWWRGKAWTDATADDLWDFEDWRTRSPRNLEKVGAARWNRGLAALTRLYRWAVRCEYVATNPIEMRERPGLYGEVVATPAARAKNAKSSNVHWLTPRMFRLWVNVGLRGHTTKGLVGGEWVGRLEDRNASFADLLFCSGLRLTEGASLLTLELPGSALDGGKYYPARLARAVTKSKKARTFYISASALVQIESYLQAGRAAAIRRAQARDLYDTLPEMRVVTKVSGHRKKVLHWHNRNGAEGRTALNDATVEERMTFFTPGPTGPEPLWIWLTEAGLPFRPLSWENVFRAANERCETVLSGVMSEPPFATPHSARHSFALYMLVALHHAMDLRMGLTPEERRDFRLLYGDPWRMVQDLLGHSDVATTRDHYLAPVSDLQLRSLLADPDPARSQENAERSDERVTTLLARLARESEGIQDFHEAVVS